MSDARTAMDNMYRLQRHFYDLTRKYYLLGRDRLIEHMDVQPGHRVLEIGCGTARNLVKLARRAPHSKLYGLDASAEMLKTAEQKIERRALSSRIMLKQCLAEELDHAKTFGLEEPFDAIFFSYALSMIPTWEAALEAAMNNIKPGGVIYIVDFWDQAELPSAFRALLKQWLKMFHVQHRPEMIARLQQWSAEERCALDLEALGGRYALIASVTPLTCAAAV